ncbi:hypothetical protein THAOC_36376, partial [Thalassiosira oceanica]
MHTVSSAPPPSSSSRTVNPPVPDRPAPGPMPPVPAGNAGLMPPGPGLGAPSRMPAAPGRVVPPDAPGATALPAAAKKGPARPRLISTLKKSRPDVGGDANDEYDDDDGYGVRGCPTGVHPTNSEFTPHKYPCAASGSSSGSGGGGDAVLPVPQTGARPPVSDDEARGDRPSDADARPAVPPSGDAATRLT